LLENCEHQPKVPKCPHLNDTVRLALTSAMLAKNQQKTNVLQYKIPLCILYRLPYMEASLRELMRITSIFSLGIAHRAIEDTHLSGYFIPKASV